MDGVGSVAEKPDYVFFQSKCVFLDVTCSKLYTSCTGKPDRKRNIINTAFLAKKLYKYME